MADEAGAEGETKKQIEKRPIKTGLAELQRILGEEGMREFIPPEEQITSFTMETFVSEYHQKMSYSMMPERYGDHDAEAFEIKDENGDVTVIHRQKKSHHVLSLPADMGGWDLRPWMVFAYRIEGENELKVMDPERGINQYTAPRREFEKQTVRFRDNLGELKHQEEFSIPRPVPQQ